jgi:hypothetical protein
MACEVKYKGQTLSFEEFAEKLHNGLLDEFIAQGVVKNIPTIKSIQDAVQKQSAEGVLPRQQGKVGEAGGEGQGMGQGKQGQEAAKPSKEEITSAEATIALDEETELLIEGLAAERRRAGKFTIDGITYTRNEKGQGIVSEKGGYIRFTSEPGGGGVVVPFRYKLAEAKRVQPSHEGGLRNPNFFIPEGQPKNRNDQASLQAEDDFANNPRFDELGEDSGAYKGAPVANERDEIIQGNSRGAGIKKGYAVGNNKYKQDLAANAEKFGFTKEQVESMENPMLVREVITTDEKAIELGNYDVKDLETAGKRRIDPSALVRRLPSKVKASLAKMISAGETIKESIRDNADEIYQLIRPYINTSIANTIITNGKLNSVGIEDVESLFTQFLFQNGDPNLPQMFEGLSNTQREGIKKSLPYLLSAGAGRSIIADVQEAIIALHYFRSSGVDGFQAWANQIDETGKAKKDSFTPLALKLAENFNKATSQNEIAGIPQKGGEVSSFAKYSQLTQGTEGGLFEEAQEGMSRQDAVKEAFGVEYTPRKGYTSAAKFEESEAKRKEIEKEKAEKEKAKQTKKEIKGKLKELEEKTNAVSDFLRNNLKIKPKEWVDKDGNPIKIAKSGMDAELWNEIVDGIADLIDSGVELSKAVNQYLSGQKWFTDLSKDNQEFVIGQAVRDVKEAYEQAKQQEAKATTQEAKDALSNFRKIMSRALNGKINEDTRSALNEKEKTYIVEPMNPVEQEKRAKELIEKHGMDNLLEDVMSGKINGSVATLIWGVSLKMLGADYKALKESGLDEEAKIIARKQADLIDTYDNLARELGRQLNALKVVYEISEEAFHYYAQRKIRGINAMQIAGLESKIEEIKQELEKVKKFASSRLQTDVELERAINKKRNATAQRTQLSDNEKKRKAELNADLKKDFGGIFMDINQVVPQVLKLVKDERFREYAKLVIKDVNYDFKQFSKQILDNVNKTYKKALKPFIFQIYRDAGGKDSGIEYEKENALKDRIQEELGKSMPPSVTEKVMKALTEANKGLWGKYKKQAAQNIVGSLASLENQRESNTALDLFIKGLVKNFKGELTNKEEKAAAEKRSDIDILRDVFQNTEKYEQVLLKAREQFLEKYDPNEEGISIEKRQERIEALTKLDEVIGRVYEQPFSDVLVSNAVSDIVGKSIKSFVYLKAKGFKGIEQLKEDVIEKIIFQTGLIREEAEALVNSIEKDLNAKIKAGQDKFDAEVESARQRVKEAASVAREKKKANLPVWKARRDNAIQALKEKLKSRVMDKIPQQKLALEEFTKRLKGNINSSINEAIKREASEITKKDNVDALVEILNNRDKYNEVLEKTADEIRKEYKDDPYMLNLFEQALYGISENPFNKKTADLATRQALRSVIGDEYTTELMNIAKDYYEGDTKVKGELLNYLVDKTGLDKDYLAPIAKEIEDAYDRIVKGYVENATERIFGTKEKPTIAKVFEGRKVKQTIEAINVALRQSQFDPNFDFEKVITEKLGLINIDSVDVKAALDNFAKQIFASKDAPLYKQIAMINLEDWLANKQKESAIWEIFKGQTYANMLYDIGTHLKNTRFNIPQSLVELGLTSVTNPRYATLMAKQFVKGLPEGLDEAVSIIRTGYPKSTEKPSQRAFSERKAAEANANKAMKGWGVYASIPTRFLAALDSALMFPLKRANSVVYMARELKADFEKQNPGQRISKAEVIRQIENALDGNGAYASKFEELRNLSEKQTKEFYGIPESQPLFDSNNKPVYKGKNSNEVYRNFRRNFYLLKERNLDFINSKEQAENLASISLLTSIPTGNAFLFYKFAMWFGKFFGLVKLVESPFVKVPLNLVNQAIEWSPLGFYNAFTGKESFAPEDWAKTQGLEVNIDPIRRRNIMAKATASTIGMMAVYALTKIKYDDDDEGERPILIVYADGTGNYRKNEKIKRLSGINKYEPYTIDFMGTRISYLDSPFKTLFLPTGFISDQERYGEEGDIPERELEIGEKIITGTAGLFLFIKDMSAIQGLVDLLNIGERSRVRKEGETLEKAAVENMKIQGTKALRNIVVPNIVPGQYRQYKGFMDMTESARPKTVYDRMFKDIPYFDQFVGKKYDHFGKPINERWKFPGLYTEPTEGNTFYDTARRKGYLKNLKYFNSASYQAPEGDYALDDNLIDKIAKLQASYAGFIFEQIGQDNLENMSKEEFRVKANGVFELAKDIAAINMLYGRGDMSKENFMGNAEGLSFELKETYGINPEDFGLSVKY